MLGLYERILEQTHKKGITGKQLGELLGLKKSPLTDWKNKKSNPTLEQLITMCEIFATSSDYLLFGKVISLTEAQQELIGSKEESLLHSFRLLSEKDQEEIEELIEFKLYKREKDKLKITKSDEASLPELPSSDSKTG